MSQTPLQTVKKRFETKEKLVAAVEKLATKELWVGRVNEVKGLGKVSNAKLIRLHDLLSDAKQRFGSREKLIGAIAELARRSKDADWLKSLEKLPLPRLLDLHASAGRRAKRAGAQPAASKPRVNKYPPKAKPAEPKAVKAEPAKAEAKSEKASKPAASKPAASKAPAEKKPAAEKKAPAEKKPAAKKAAVKKE